MESKFNEEIIVTTDFSKMRDKFLAKRLLRGWKEDFIDEDSGEVVEIERHEVIFQKGTFLGSEELGVINFHMQEGSVTEVHVSDQCRTGVLTSRSANVWIVSAAEGNKKYNVYLYADSIDNCQMIAADYLEQLLIGNYSFVGIRELDFSVLIPETFYQDEKNEEDKHYYKMEISLLQDDFENNKTYIVKADNAERAKIIIEKFIAFKQAEENISEEFSVTILSAKKIPCNYVIGFEFSKPYLKDDGEKI